MARKRKPDVPVPSGRKKPSMQERGYKALTTFVKLASYFALERYGKDSGIAHSAYLRDLLEQDLRKKGYLPDFSKPDSPRKIRGGVSRPSPES